jgi:uncharacterized protein (DUF58 family)
MAKRAKPQQPAPSPSGASGSRLKFLDAGALSKLGPLDLVARHVVAGMRVGSHRSPLKGFSTEFAQHRQYVVGDSLKHIDWRVYSRTGRYNVKLYEAETDFTAHLLLDASASMQYGSHGVSKFDYARLVTCCLAHLIVDQRDAVGLAVFDAGVRKYVPPRSSAGAVRELAREMEALGCEPRTDITSILHELANKIPRRGFVILVSDLLDNVDEFLKGLQHLRHRGHNVIVVHTMDPAELTFPFNVASRFLGLEGDGELVTQPHRVRAAYLTELHQYLDRVRVSCERANVEYVLADTSHPVEQVLSAFLLGRSAANAR